jgi:predicted nucleotidyltransferase
MKPSIALQNHRNAVRTIALNRHVKNVRVFGSVLHGNDTAQSDLDLLVDTTPQTTLLDIGAIRYELRQLLGVPVDVLTPMSLPEKFRQTVVEEARPI